MRVVPALAVFLVAVGGCANEHDIARLDQEDVFYQEGTDALDILWIVDDSNSMAGEQTLVAEGFNQFIRAVGTSEVDFQIGVITTDMDEENPDRARLVGDPPFLTRTDDYSRAFMERVRVGTEGSDKERGLQAAWEALSSATVADTNAGFLREEAVLALVFVSDENDCSDDNFIPDAEDGSLCYEIPDRLVSTRDYVRWYRGLKDVGGRVVVSSIVGPSVTEGCEYTRPGQRYMTVSAELDGVVGNICESDFGDLMEDIGERVAGPARSFYLSFLPVVETVEVWVDGEEVAEDEVEGWIYDGELNAVRFLGVWVPELGAEIKVRYDIAFDE